jgi:cysteine desulfurase
MIYLDFAAATYVDPRVKKAMEDVDFGNPGSFHSSGLRSFKIMSDARHSVAKNLNCLPCEIVFTGSGTESLNLAIKGVFRANKGHIITSAIEHHAVLETCKYLEKYEGADITYLPVDKFGRVSKEDLEKAIKPNTVLISLIYANNEIGTINNIAELSKIAKKHNVLFHTDACQAGFLNVDVKRLGVDLLTLNGTKLYGPRGVGILFVRKGLVLHPIIHGGGQELGLRSGTEDVSSIVGFSCALELAQKEKNEENERLTMLRNKLIDGLLKIPRTLLNGHPDERLPNNVNVSFLDIEGESLLLHLNEKGICASTGSACSSKNLSASHVLVGIGLPQEVAHGSIRFTLGRNTKEADIDAVLWVIPDIVKNLRRLSPVRVEVDNG